MLELPTTVLLHVAPGQSHHDWLLADPNAGARADAPLVAFRLAPPPAHWAAARAFALVRLPAHRRRYLAYQGPLGNARGSVRRADRGVVWPRLWCGRRFVVDVRLRAFAGTVSAWRVDTCRWLACAEATVEWGR